MTVNGGEKGTVDLDLQSADGYCAYATVPDMAPLRGREREDFGANCSYRGRSGGDVCRHDDVA